MSINKTQRKIKKLLNDPKGFVQDSPIGKASYFLRGQSDPSKCSGLDVGPCTEDLSPRAKALTFAFIKQEIANRASVFFIDGNGGRPTAVCALEREYSELIQSILRLCYSESLLLSFENEGEFVVPRTVRSASAALQVKRFLVLRLTDKRSEAIFDLEIQAWKEYGDHILAPTDNIVSKKVWKRVLEQHGIPAKGTVMDLACILGGSLEGKPDFPVDFVYTWVNSDDPEWQKMFAEHRSLESNDGNSLSRFYNRNELMFSLRSLEEYAPWIRTIYIVSNCSPPSWLNLENQRIRWITHEEIFERNELPTFSSHAIETKLHKIDGLSNYFVYSNDDFLLTRPTTKNDFFTSSGLCNLKLEPWGNVNGEAREGEPDYINGARNCQALIERDFNISPTRLHCHAPQALRVDILEEMEERYKEAFAITSAAKFRAVTDVAVTGFFFHHYAYVTGRAFDGNIKTLLIQQNHNFVRKYNSVVEERTKGITSERHLSICVNDGADSHLNVKWNRVTEDFLGKYFPVKSSFEK